jgi:hypothetical protein
MGKKSKNLAAQAATASGLEIIKKYIRLIERLELEEGKKKDRMKAQDQENSEQTGQPVISLCAYSIEFPFFVRESVC